MSELTKEEIAEMRERCEPFTDEWLSVRADPSWDQWEIVDKQGGVHAEIFGQKLATATAHARTDLPRALDALDAKDARIELLSVKVSRLQGQLDLRSDRADRLERDRDQWRERAEAVEAAIVDRDHESALAWNAFLNAEVTFDLTNTIEYQRERAERAEAALSRIKTTAECDYERSGEEREADLQEIFYQADTALYEAAEGGDTDGE